MSDEKNEKNVIQEFIDDADNRIDKAWQAYRHKVLTSIIRWSFLIPAFQLPTFIMNVVQECQIATRQFTSQLIGVTAGSMLSTYSKRLSFPHLRSRVMTLEQAAKASLSALARTAETISGFGIERGWMNTFFTYMKAWQNFKNWVETGVVSRLGIAALVISIVEFLITIIVQLGATLVILIAFAGMKAEFDAGDSELAALKQTNPIVKDKVLGRRREGRGEK